MSVSLYLDEFKMKVKRYFILSLLVSVSLFSVGCAKKEIAVAPPAEEENEGAEEELEDSEGRITTFSLTGFTEKGEKKWEIEGESADIMSDKVILENVKVSANSEGKQVTITAKKGYFDKLTNNVRFEEDVVAITDEGVRLTTDYLDWQAEDETISSQANVFVERENITISGTGIYAVPSLKKARINKNVTVKIKSLRSTDSGEESLVTTITSVGPLEVDHEKQIAIFNDQVKVVDERGDIFSDRMDVYLNPKEEGIDKVVAVGNVKILREGNTTYSQKAVYESKEGKLTLTGRPRLVIYSANTSFSELE